MLFYPFNYARCWVCLSPLVILNQSNSTLSKRLICFLVWGFHVCEEKIIMWESTYKVPTTQIMQKFVRAIFETSFHEHCHPLFTHTHIKKNCRIYIKLKLLSLCTVTSIAAHLFDCLTSLRLPMTFTIMTHGKLDIYVRSVVPL